MQETGRASISDHADEQGMRTNAEGEWDSTGIGSEIDRYDRPPGQAFAQGRPTDTFEYLGSKRFMAAANANAPARIVNKETYEPVESNARPSITGPMAPAAA